MSYRNALIIIFTFIISITACAKEDKTPDLAELWLSKSVGVWEKGQDYGYFKVLVYRTGLEPAGDKVQVIVTRADTKKNRQTVKLTKWLDTPGYKGYVNDIDLKILKPDKLILGLDIEMKGMDGVVLKEVYIVEMNGVVKKVTDAEYKDIY